MAIKQYLTKPPILVSPDASDTLYLYLTVSEVSISVALFKEDGNRKQRPIFFVRKSLSEAETRYTRLEQAALALRVAAKKLRPYFQAHPIVVLTNLPLQSTIHKPDLSWRMARWAIELSEFGIQYKPRLALKGQILAYFLAEIQKQDANPSNTGWWILNVDGASWKTKAGISLTLKAPIGERIEKDIQLGFPVYNTETEYEAILAGIDLAISMSLENIFIQSDSQLVVGHVNGKYETRDQCMAKYVSLVKLRLGSFVAWRLEHIPRDSNERADALAAVASSLPIKETVFLPVYYQPKSSTVGNRIHEIGKTSSLMTLIVHYLSSGELSDSRIEAHKILVQVAQFSLMNGQLYKQSPDGPYLKCLITQ